MWFKDILMLTDGLIKSTKLTEKAMIFTTAFNHLSGGRCDSHFNQKKYEYLYTILYQGSYGASNLQKESKLITSGATPLSGGNAYITDKNIGVPFVRSGEINQIDFDSCIYIRDEIHNTVLKSSQLKNGDLLIAIVGATIGVVGVYDYDRKSNINQAIALVRF